MFLNHSEYQYIPANITVPEDNEKQKRPQVLTGFMIMEAAHLCGPEVLLLLTWSPTSTTNSTAFLIFCNLVMPKGS